jgi:hypothetical protein
MGGTTKRQRLFIKVYIIIAALMALAVIIKRIMLWLR